MRLASVAFALVLQGRVDLGQLLLVAQQHHHVAGLQHRAAVGEKMCIRDRNSALRSLSRFQLEKGAIHHETLNSPQELRAYLSQLQEATQRSLGIQAQQAQEEKKQAVLAFIKEHYGDADLMIYPLCKELGCSESSLNRFIHEQLGL